MSDTAPDFVVLQRERARAITYEEMRQMIRAFTAKAERAPNDDVESIVTQVVADTLLVVDGTIPMAGLADW